MANNAPGREFTVNENPIRGSDPRPQQVAIDEASASKGDRGWDDLPPSYPLTGPLPFTALSDGRITRR